ncbi:conserved protein, unknown function [Hepatocystis sp. ex Piliocolobus tephrosceles]|nr:conserved protein, unknown function [Hepatocystis sp. ex Piliocolobus tephrosceles]
MKDRKEKKKTTVEKVNIKAKNGKKVKKALKENKNNELQKYMDELWDLTTPTEHKKNKNVQIEKNEFSRYKDNNNIDENKKEKTKKDKKSDNKMDNMTNMINVNTNDIFYLDFDGKKKQKGDIKSVREVKKDEQNNKLYPYKKNIHVMENKMNKNLSSMNNIRSSYKNDNLASYVSKVHNEKETKTNTQILHKEKKLEKKNFMDNVHEIRKLALPHLNKFQKKIVQNYQIKSLGGTFDKSQKCNFKELMFRRKAMKKYDQKRKKNEQIIGVKTQSGNYINMQDVLRKKKKEEKKKKSKYNKLF